MCEKIFEFLTSNRVLGLAKYPFQFGVLYSAKRLFLDSIAAAAVENPYFIQLQVATYIVYLLTFAGFAVQAIRAVDPKLRQSHLNTSRPQVETSTSKQHSPIVH